MPTRPARLDAAVDTLLAGEQIRGGELGEVASLLHAALRPIPPSFRFEDRLRRRLRGGPRFAWPQLSASRLIAAGAVSSAAVGVTALAVWRTSRRQTAGRAWHR